jgi:phosphoribosylformimino-5-aminoimidazole carboxamide ribotide isomerase
MSLDPSFSSADASMIVPVIDLLQGQVVRAVRGERRHYRPIASRLARGSDPVVVAAALREASGARRFYVADLDALLGRAAQSDTLAALATALPDIEWWIDAGFADRSAADALLERLRSHAPRIVPVFASEALGSRAAFEHCFDRASPVHAKAMLSLDRRGGERLDAAGCWDAPDRWPADVIVMTLERVGAGTGPDLATLAALRACAPIGTRFIGAGGIRDAADLRAARAAGANAWLVASALHDGRLPACRA